MRRIEPLHRLELMRNTAPSRRKLGKPRLLIIGCGDIGLRIVARLKDRFRIIALTSSPARKGLLRAAGTVPLAGDLDRGASLRRIAAAAPRLIYLAPPPGHGDGDPRLAHALAALRGGAARTVRTARARRVMLRGGFVYASTTGVYGDRGGARVDERTPAAATTPRARRRVDAERHARAAGAAVLRIPGIYAHDRLPLDRLRQGLPALREEDDVFTNHIHGDDLARIAVRTLMVGRRSRVYNAVDDSDLKMGAYLDLVANWAGLPRPPRVARESIATQVSAAMLSYLQESRRIDNRRLHQELRVRLRYPTVQSALGK
jgi:nucleoside-diphosphate-sugar epimerase